jgi:hypothetical protein
MPHNTLAVPWGRHGGRDASDRRSGRRWVLGPHRAGRGLATPARLGRRIGLSTIPLYPLDGLAFGNSGLLPSRFSEHSVQTVAEIGVVLLLSTHGLEDTGVELGANHRAGRQPGAVDFLLQLPPRACSPDPSSGGDRSPRCCWGARLIGSQRSHVPSAPGP